MLLIDKKGSRPVCEACNRATKEYGIVVPAGRVFVCGDCLKKPSLTVPVRPRKIV